MEIMGFGDTSDSKLRRGSKTNKNYDDFSNYVTDSKTKLGGVNDKIVVIKDGRRYMLKFATERQEGYRHDHITEYLACKVAKKLGYDVQEVELGYYNGKECVAVELFEGSFVSFGFLGESVLSSIVLEDRKDYDIEWILKVGDRKKIKVDTKEFSDWVWNTFLLDMFVGNYDRHSENWGFLLDIYSRTYSLAPLIDMGSSFEPKLVCKNTEGMTDHDIMSSIESKMKSAIMHNNRKRTYSTLMEHYVERHEFGINLEEFLNKVEDINIEEELNYIEEYSKDYSLEYNNYTKFVRRLIKLKVEYMRRYVNYE